MAGIDGLTVSRNCNPGKERPGTVTRSPRVGGGGPIGLILAVSLMAQGLFVSPGGAQDVPPSPESTTVGVSGNIAVNRDSLMAEIRTYSQMIRGLRDSLSSNGSGLQLSIDQREKIEGSIADISRVIENISTELARMEFEIKDNRISLVNESGEGIVINIPENMDEHVSQGIEAITKIILSELPDSVDFDHTQSWDWSRFRPEPPPPARRVINGNVVKVWDNVHISAKEDVRGDVVVIFGDAEIAGRVDGDVVTVFGDMSLAETAEVTGDVVTVGGRLEQAPGAEVADVVVMDPLKLSHGGNWLGFLSHDGFSFLVCQGVFLLTVLMGLLAVLVTPRERFHSITGQLRHSVGGSLGLGVVTALAGHLLVAVLTAVLVLTVIGVPLALLVGLALLFAIVISVVVCGAVVGERLCALFGGQCHSRALVVVVGMTVLHLVSFVGSLLGVVGGAPMLASVLVALGVTIKVVAYLLGLGALVMSRLGTRAVVAKG